MVARVLNTKHVVLSIKLFIYVVDGRKYRFQLNDHFVRYKADDVLITNRRKCGMKLEIKRPYISNKTENIYSYGLKIF
jgi:hypothetical protein